MPRIDPLLTALVSNRAEAVMLSDGDIAHIIKGGAQHPLTRQPLAEGQLLLLLREMAPAEIAPALSGAEPVQFTYSNAEGDFVARVTRENGMLQATVRPGSPVATANGSGRASASAGAASGSNGKPVAA